MKRATLPELGVFELVVLHVVALLTIGWLTRTPGYTELYFRISLELTQGRVPYRDFGLEYPPLALVPFLLPRLATLGQPLGPEDYEELFLCLNVFLSVLTALCVAAIARRAYPARKPAVAVAGYVLLAPLMAPMLAWRYDSFAALLTALALLAVVQQRPLRAGLWLGLGATAKIYPLFLLGVFGAHYLAAGERRALLRLAFAALATVALVLLPFRFLAGDQWLSFLSYHQERGFQIESVIGGALWLGDTMGLVPVTWIFNYGAYHISSPVANALIPWQAALFPLGLGGVVLVYLERFQEERRSTGEVGCNSLIRGTVVMLLAALVGNKVFSPQFLIWLIPFVPLLPGRTVALFAGIAALTIYVYPFQYQPFLNGELVPVLALNCRNLLVIALTLVVLFPREHKRSAVTALA